MLTSVCLYASQLAACVGHNRFKKPCDALELVWERVSPHSFRDALHRNHIKTVDETVRAIASANESVKHLLVQAEETAPDTSIGVARGYKVVSEKLDTVSPELNREERKLVDDAMKKTMYTKFGNKQENVALETIRAKIPCVEDETFYKKWVADVDGVPVYIGGKIDAITQDGSTIIEIKNRINRLFFNIPSYERVQVLAYLYTVPQASKAALVECLTREDGIVLTHTIPIEWDEDYWCDVIVPRITRFVRYLLTILRDPAEQDAYLQSSRKASMVLRRLNSGS